MILTQPDRDRLITLLKTYRAHGISGACQALRRTVDRAVVVEPWKVPDGVVTMNSVVSLIDLTNGEISTYALVYPSEANIDRLRISVLTPLGSALLGRTVGDIVACNVPTGTRRYFIHKLTYQPERRYHVDLQGTAVAQ